MLILLPPSETKTRPVDGARAHPAAARSSSLAEHLSSPRATMADAVARTAAGPEGGSRLGVPASAPELVGRMAALSDEPLGAPLSVYSGVLYDQLGDAQPGEDRRVLIMSALHGLVDPRSDAIPAYRVSASSAVEGLGKAGTWWKQHLTPLVPQLMEEVARSASPFVLDCRSGAYRSMMPLRSSAEVTVLQVSPVAERGGRRTVISHDAKSYRGWLTRALLEDPSPLPDLDALVRWVQQAAGDRLGVEVDGGSLVLVDRAEDRAA